MNQSIKLHILHCGQVEVSTYLPFSKDNQPSKLEDLIRTPENQITVPVTSYLVEHPKGLVLVDTGWDTVIHGSDQEQIDHLSTFHYKVARGILPQGQAINEQLLERGIKPQDLDYVILSHLHSDHASGLKLVKDAKNILVSEEEWQAALINEKNLYMPFMWEGVDVRTFQFTSSKYGPFNQSFDLFGDDSVILVHAPGHTPGLIATLIQRNGKFVLLTSDCGYAKKSWEQWILPGGQSNSEQLVKSLQWEKKMSQNPNRIDILATHDADVKPHTIEI